jgi:acyl carrier protein
VDVKARVEALVLEYAENPPPGALDPNASLRNDLGVDSLSLVSVAVALGNELGVDLVESDTELGKLETVANLIALGHALTKSSAKEQSCRP